MMAEMAALKAHPVKISYNEQSQPSKTWNSGNISPQVLFIVHTQEILLWV